MTAATAPLAPMHGMVECGIPRTWVSIATSPPMPVENQEPKWPHGIFDLRPSTLEGTQAHRSTKGSPPCNSRKKTRTLAAMSPKVATGNCTGRRVASVRGITPGTAAQTFSWQ